MALAVACSAEPSDASRDGSLFAETPSQQWRLPDRLREISGLAVTADGRVFAHDDERGVIYQLDAARGEVLKSFSLGEPAIRDDFEGLAITPNGDFWLTNSQGELYSFREGADGAHVEYQRHDVGLADVCEIEGLAYLAETTSLIFACKRPYENGGEMAWTPLRSWAIGDYATGPWAQTRDNFATLAGVHRFQPSGVEIDPASGRVIVISAGNPALVELDHEGNVLAARRLRGHPQPEGVTVLPDGSLIVSDEAAGGHPRLSRYSRIP